MAASTQSNKWNSCQTFHNGGPIDWIEFIFIYIVSVVHKPKTSNNDQRNTPCQEKGLSKNWKINKYCDIMEKTKEEGLIFWGDHILFMD